MIAGACLHLAKAATMTPVADTIGATRHRRRLVSRARRLRAAVATAVNTRCSGRSSHTPARVYGTEADGGNGFTTKERPESLAHRDTYESEWELGGKLVPLPLIK